MSQRGISHSDVTKSGWWFGTFYIFPYIGNNHPNWLSYFSEGWLNHQPDPNVSDVTKCNYKFNSSLVTSVFRWWISGILLPSRATKTWNFRQDHLSRRRRISRHTCREWRTGAGDESLSWFITPLVIGFMIDMSIICLQSALWYNDFYDRYSMFVYNQFYNLLWL